MTWTVWAAIVIVILTVAALIKRYETRLVLLASGFLMTCLSLDPMQGLNAFAKSMTNSGLIMAICSAMGFAFVVQMTKCDVHLVKASAVPVPPQQSSAERSAPCFLPVFLTTLMWPKWPTLMSSKQSAST